ALLEACKDNDIEIRKDSRLLVSPFSNLSVTDIPDDCITAPFPLDDKQREAIAEWLNHGMGIAHFSVSAGKTLTFAGAAAVIKKAYPEARFLYFTPSERLVRQTHAEMVKALPGWDIGQFGGGKKNTTAKDM